MKVSGHPGKCVIFQTNEGKWKFRVSDKKDIKISGTDEYTSPTMAAKAADQFAVYGEIVKSSITEVPFEEVPV